MVWPAIIGAIAGLGMGASSSDGQRKANHEELDFLRESRAIGVDMANSSYQRAVRDMTAAGLSPMLAYSQGGAPVPAGPGSPSLENTVGAGVASAAQGASMVGGFQQMAQSAATTEQLEAQTEKIRTETMSHEVNTAYRAEELKRLAAEAKERGVSADVAKRTQNATESGRIAENALKELEREQKTKTFDSDVAQRKAESKLRELDIPRSEGEAEFWKKTGEMSPWIKTILQLMQAGSSARSFSR